MAYIIPFPQKQRAGKIRDVASKMLSKPTDRAAASYRDQVTESMLRAFQRSGFPEATQDEQLGAFWSAVQDEIIRQTYHGRRPGGNAA
ncbi:MAG: DUF6074 family protein [Pseudomonadota bacterium]|jgi:hypothetical protein